MPKKNNPGCKCCQNPFCCDGTPPNTITFELDSVTGTGSNSSCADSSCANSYNNAGSGGVTLARAGTSCSWGLIQAVDTICGNPAFGCDTVARTWTFTIINNGDGTWTGRMTIGTDNAPGDTSGREFVVFEYDFATTRPLCNDLSGLAFSLITDDSCCDFSSATLVTA